MDELGSTVSEERTRASHAHPHGAPERTGETLARVPPEVSVRVRALAGFSSGRRQCTYFLITVNNTCPVDEEKSCWRSRRRRGSEGSSDAAAVVRSNNTADYRVLKRGRSMASARVGFIAVGNRAATTDDANATYEDSRHITVHNF